MEQENGGMKIITFPTTPEAFIAYQEQIAGRELTEHEREATAAWKQGFHDAEERSASK